MTPKKLFLTIVFFGLIVLVLVFLPVFLRDTSPPATTLAPTTPLPQVSPAPGVNQTQAKQNAIQELPIEREGFTIEYFPSSGRFYVLIKLNPYERYEQEAKGWFAGFGLNTDNLNIQWGSVRGVFPKAE